jgi:hypothetical protein
LEKDEMLAVRRYFADLDQRMTDLAVLDRVLAEHALRDERVCRLMTLSGVHVTVAMGLLAQIGARASPPRNWKSRDSGPAPPIASQIKRIA